MLHFLYVRLFAAGGTKSSVVLPRRSFLGIELRETGW
jgi:hypothetical protein